MEIVQSALGTTVTPRQQSTYRSSRWWPCGRRSSRWSRTCQSASSVGSRVRAISLESAMTSSDSRTSRFDTFDRRAARRWLDDRRPPDRRFERRDDSLSWISLFFYFRLSLAVWTCLRVTIIVSLSRWPICRDWTKGRKRAPGQTRSKRATC